MRILSSQESPVSVLISHRLRAGHSRQAPLALVSALSLCACLFSFSLLSLSLCLFSLSVYLSRLQSDPVDIKAVVSLCPSGHYFHSVCSEFLSSTPLSLVPASPRLVKPQVRRPGEPPQPAIPLHWYVYLDCIFSLLLLLRLLFPFFWKSCVCSCAHILWQSPCAGRPRDAHLSWGDLS